MKFKDYKYERPDLEALAVEVNKLVDAFESSENFEEASGFFDQVNNIKLNVSTMSNLVYIRHSIDTRDKFYSDEQDFLDENLPKFRSVENRFNKALLASNFKEELEKKWGRQLFRMIELDLATFSEEIIDDLVEENKLCGDYSKLVASAEIDFEGQIRNLSQLSPFRQSKDREMRKRANEAYYGFFQDNEARFDEIYDGLVKVRTRMARKLGYENYLDLGYKRLCRSDYGPEEVKAYRKAIEKELVPLVKKLEERQRKRLGYDSLKYYDNSFKFLSGNPKPKGGPDWIVDNGRKMYRELSEETGEFFDFMLERELMDLESKEGKMSGGYCTFISNYKSPFIFSNFNGTSGDIDVLTHEAGHAFQTYRSRELGLEEYNFPTYEAAEIHSMSMEFITWPWMDLFFEEEADKYRFAHLAGALEFLPYGASVDEFQHFVYENPDLSPEERKAGWRRIEKKYSPELDYDGQELLERGGLWFRQGHIFESPLYYIDYTLAQVCAFQFFNKLEEDREEAWKDYLRLCDKGGSLSFLELLEVAGLENPFEEGSIKNAIEPLEKWLDKIDDSKF